MPDPMWHAPAGDEDCLFLILFDGPFGLTAVERPSDARALDVTRSNGRREARGPTRRPDACSGPVSPERAR